MKTMSISEYKEKYHKTHKEMAQLLNVSLPYYYKILNGTRKPSRNVIAYIKNNVPQIDINIFLK